MYLYPSGLLQWLRYLKPFFVEHKDPLHGLVQERRNSIALAMELCLSCTNPLHLSYIVNTMAAVEKCISSAKWWPFCPGRDDLIICISLQWHHMSIMICEATFHQHVKANNTENISLYHWPFVRGILQIFLTMQKVFPCHDTIMSHISKIIMQYQFWMLSIKSMSLWTLS